LVIDDLRQTAAHHWMVIHQKHFVLRILGWRFLLRGHGFLV
jgi:hypothetical protein